MVTISDDEEYVEYQDEDDDDAIISDMSEIGMEDVVAMAEGRAVVEEEEEEEPENHHITAVKRGSVSKVIAFVCSYAAQSRPSFPIVITRTLLSRGLA